MSTDVDGGSTPETTPGMCPEVTIHACPAIPKAPECPKLPPAPPPVIQYVGTLPHWCEAQACTAGEMFGGIFFITLAIAIAIGCAVLVAWIKASYRANTLEDRTKEAKLEAAKRETEREHTRELIKIDRERADSDYAVKLREDQRVLSQKKAEYDAMTSGYSLTPKKD